MSHRTPLPAAPPSVLPRERTEAGASGNGRSGGWQRWFSFVPLLLRRADFG